MSNASAGSVDAAARFEGTLSQITQETLEGGARAVFSTAGDTGYPDVMSLTEDTATETALSSTDASLPSGDIDRLTRRYIRNFLTGRADQLVANDPDLARRMLEDGSDVSLSGNATSRDGNIAFKGKITGEDVRLGRVFGIGAVERTGVWMDAEFAKSEKRSSDNDRSQVFVGLDYRMDRDTVIGLFGRFAMTDELNETDYRSREGWLVGPYLISRLTDTLIFDGRVAVGNASNEVTQDTGRQDAFGSNRLLFKGQFSGDFRFDDWRVNPALAIVYFEEDQESHLSDYGADVPEQAISLGRISFGPRASRTFRVSESLELTPSINLRGTWDFDQAQYVDLNSGVSAGSERLRARIDGGLTAKVSAKRRLIVDGFYDGIGVTGYQAYGMKVGMKVALE